MSYIPVTTQTAVPTTGQTVTISAGRNVVTAIQPAGALLALTINFPASPQDGDHASFSTSQAVTTLTMGGGTIVGALTSLVLGGFGTYSYNASLTSWVRIG